MASPTNDQICAALRKSRGLISLAARTIGCSRQTIYTRIQRSAKVREAVEAEREFTVDLAEAKLYQAVDAGQPWAVSLIVRTLGKDRGYDSDHRIEHSGKLEVSVDIDQARHDLARDLEQVNRRANGATART